MNVNCNYCDKEFYRKPSQIKRSKNHFCSRECCDEWKAGKSKNIESNKVRHNCHFCSNEILVENYKFQRFLRGELKDLFCDKRCLADWQRVAFKGENSARFNQSSKNCLHCKESYSVPLSLKDTSKFCSTQCHSNSRVETVSLVCYFCKSDTTKIKSHVKNLSFCDRECYTNFLRTDEGRKLASKNGALSVYSQKSSETKPELMMREYLEKHNIEFVSQYSIGSYVADFYLIETNTVLEVYGDYWHGNPNIYGEDENKKAPFNDMQLNSHKRDAYRQKYMEDKGYNFYFIWEDDIYNRIEEATTFLHNL